MKKALLACAVLCLSFLMVPSVSAARQYTLYGFLSDSKCTTKGTTESHRDCMEKCLAKGGDVILVTDDDHRLIRIENQESVKGHHAHRVALDGYMNGDFFHVISVRIL